MSELDPPAPHEPAPATPARTVGELLREGRARHNLSAADVARHLRLSLRQVEALEANEFGTLPSTIVRGFIRNYARLLQMDPAPLLAAFEAASPGEGPELPRKGERIDISPSPSRRWLIYLVLVLAVVVGVPLLIYGLLHDDGGLAGGGGSPVPKSRGTAVPPGGGGTGVELALPAAPPLAPAAPAVPSPAADAPADGAPAAQETQPEAAREASLHFVFEDDAWVEVRDGHGRRIFSQLSPRGSEQTLRGEGPFSLVVGNAHRVRLAYNGKPVDLAPHIKVNVARLTLE